MKHLLVFPKPFNVNWISLVIFDLSSVFLIMFVACLQQQHTKSKYFTFKLTIHRKLMVTNS